MVYDPRSAPPNISQLEAHEGDADEATKEQQSEEDTDKLNEEVRKVQREALDEQLELKQKRLDRLGTSAVGDTRREFRKEGGKEDKAEAKAQEDAEKKQAHPEPSPEEEKSAREAKLAGKPVPPKPDSK